MTISAIVVAFRSAAHLPGLLKDLEREGVDEIVVVDNASPDDSARVAEEASGRVRVIRLRENRGFAAGVNAGVCQATGAHLLIINPDVRIEEGAVRRLLTAAGRHPRTVCGPQVSTEDGRVLPTRKSLPSLGSVLAEEVWVPERARIGGWPQRRWAKWDAAVGECDAPLLSGVCLLLPRALWDDVGEMDEGYFLYWEEIDWQLRARSLAAAVLYVPDARIRHVRSASLGLHDPRRSRLLAQSTVRFLRHRVGGVRGRVLLAAFVVGQAVRWLLWSWPGLRSRPHAGARRAQHRGWLQGALRGGQ
jgi:GT2 family glycosyltransferase